MFLLRCMSLKLALCEHSKMHAACPLSGANPTLGRIYAHTPS
jgi:hypothetical protein